MHTVHKGDLLFHTDLSGGIVRHKHKFLNNTLGHTLNPGLDIDTNSVLVTYHLALTGLYLGCTSVLAFLYQYLCKLVHKRYAVYNFLILLLCQSCCRAVKDRIYLAVHTLYARTDNSLCKLVFLYSALVRYLHKA